MQKLLSILAGSALPTCAALLAMAMPITAQADTVFQFGNGMIPSGQVNFVGVSSGVTGGDYTVHLPVNLSSDVAGGQIIGKPLYGGYYGIQKGVTSAPSVRLRTRDRAAGDQIELNCILALTGGNLDYSGFFFWKAESFETPFKTGLDGAQISGFSLRTQSAPNGVFKGRFVVQTASGLYVNETVISGTNLWELPFAGASKWAAYTPSGTGMKAPTSGYTIDSSMLGQVTGAGFYIEGYIEGKDGQTPQVNVEEFKVEGTTSAPGTFALTINPANGGTVTPNSGAFASGTVVNVVATASEGFAFTQWSGDVTGVNNTLALTMNRDWNITPVFSPIGSAAFAFPVSFNNGELAAFFEPITTATFSETTGGLAGSTAISHTGNEQVIHALDAFNFSGKTPEWKASVAFLWEGATATDGKMALQIGSIGDKTTVPFDLNPHNTGFAQAYGFRGGILNNGATNKVYLRLNYVSGNDKPDNTFGKSFTEEGDITLIPGNFYVLELTVKFVSGEQYNTSVSLFNADSNGQRGSLVAKRGRPAASPETNAAFSKDTTNYLFIAADSGQRGIKLIDQLDSTLEAVTRSPVTLTTTVSGQGTVSVTPAGPYLEGDVVTLTANPANGYKFTSWSGGASGSVNTVTLTLDTNKSVMANFTTVSEVTASVMVDPTVRFQEIIGFGTGANGWSRTVWENYFTEGFPEKYTEDLGASMLRVDIWAELMPSKVDNWQDITYKNFNLGTWPGSPNRAGVYARWAQLVHQNKVDDMRVIGTVWSAPPWMKTNNSIINGGRVKDEYFQHFAKYLHEWTKMMEIDFGVPIYAISLQNELHFAQIFESGVYTPAQYRDLLKVVGAYFKSQNSSTLIFGPEDMTKSLDRTFGFIKTVMDDPDARDHLDVFATHGYVDGVISSGSVGELAAMWNKIKGYNRPYWITETSADSPVWEDNVFLDSSGNPKPGALTGTGGKLHNALVYGNVSAFLFWQFTESRLNQHGFMGMQTPGKAFYVAKHYYKHIRPGAVRIDAAHDNKKNVDASAYIHDENGDLVIVLLNRNFDQAETTVTLNHTTSAEFKVWRSTATEEYLAQPDITTSTGSLTISIPPRSIVTLVDSNYDYSLSGWVEDAAFGQVYHFDSEWAWSSWLGFMYKGFQPWTYVFDLGWVYAFSPAFFYIPELGWVWLSSEYYPQIYSYSEGQFITLP